MDGVEASRIVESTLNQISDLCQMKRDRLREIHRPILVALQKECAEKVRIAEAKGYERGRGEAEGLELAALDGVQNILKELHGETIRKRRTAEEKALDRGRMASEMRHWQISLLGFGRIAKGGDVMDKAGVHCIIESAIRFGGKLPSIENQKLIEQVQSELELCASIDEVVEILEANRSLICNSFGVDDSAFDECVADVQSLATGSVQQSANLSEDEFQAGMERGLRNYSRIVKNGELHEQS